LGDFDAAFSFLDAAVKQRNGWLMHLVTNPIYDAIRADSRYQTLLEQIGLAKTRVQ
jgi:hypothetical protein